MSEHKFPNRKNTRLKEYDYSNFGFYFVTICMKRRKEFFSKIIDGKSELTEYGMILDEIIKSLNKYYPIEIDYYIIMPDHIHLIMIIDNEKQNNKKTTLSEVIGKFKSYSTKNIRQNLKGSETFEWQKSFYDRIIRNEKELFRIRKYIEENPIRWEIEREHPENLEI